MFLSLWNDFRCKENSVCIKSTKKFILLPNYIDENRLLRKIYDQNTPQIVMCLWILCCLIVFECLNKNAGHSTKQVRKHMKASWCGCLGLWTYFYKPCYYRKLWYGKHQKDISLERKWMRFSCSYMISIIGIATQFGWIVDFILMDA